MSKLQPFNQNQQLNQLIKKTKTQSEVRAIKKPDDKNSSL